MSDVLLYQTDDDGEINIQNGIIEMSGGLETAAYLSLFGGNEDDDGSDQSITQWWGNLSETQPARTYRSRTQSLVASLPLTSANLKRIEDAALADLNWFLTERVASEVTVTASIPAVNRVDINVVVNAFGNLQEFNFTDNWGDAHSREGNTKVTFLPSEPDPFFSDVQILMHFDGADGSQDFVNSASNGIQPSAGADAVITTSNSKFGSGSKYTLVDPDGGLVYPDVNEFKPGTGDFTIETWVYITANPTEVSTIFSGNAIVIEVLSEASGRFLRWFGPFSPLIASVSPVPIKEWVHIAVCRVSGTVRLFINGIKDGEGIDNTNLSTAGVNNLLYKGSGGSTSYAVLYDEFRYTVGVGRYTSDFDVPTEPFSNFGPS